MNAVIISSHAAERHVEGMGIDLLALKAILHCSLSTTPTP